MHLQICLNFSAAIAPEIAQLDATFAQKKYNMKCISACGNCHGNQCKNIDTENTKNIQNWLKKTQNIHTHNNRKQNKEQTATK